MSVLKKILITKLLKILWNYLFIGQKDLKSAFGINKQKALFGIVQGGLFNDLRVKSLNELIKIDFDGYALGGLAVGETQKEMFEILDNIKEHMPENKPRYLMGVGTPSDILGAVKRGIRHV